MLPSHWPIVCLLPPERGGNAAYQTALAGPMYVVSCPQDHVCGRQRACSSNPTTPNHTGGKSAREDADEDAEAGAEAEADADTAVACGSRTGPCGASEATRAWEQVRLLVRLWSIDGRYRGAPPLSGKDWLVVAVAPCRTDRVARGRWTCVRRWQVAGRRSGGRQQAGRTRSPSSRETR